MPRYRHRYLFAAALLSAAGVLLFAGKPLDAGVKGSPHDFSTGGPFTQSTVIAPSGVCSSCHMPHRADPYSLWSRSLADYRTLLEVNGGGTYFINYVHAPTLSCYDCHDTHTSGNINDLPPSSAFTGSHKPQDIAFGGDGPRGTAGYYENNPPDNTYQKGANPNLNPDDNTQLAKTGGHYFRYKDPDGAGSAFRKGDKLPCSDCHDPHEYSSTWGVFLRKDLPGNSDWTFGSTAYGSYMMSNLSTGSHDNTYSRRICVSCHTFSDTGAAPVRYNQINTTAYTDTSTIPKPPTTVEEHSSLPSVSNVPCVSCHKHNSVSVGCNSCHSYPGQDNAISGRQLSPVHWKHVGKPGVGGGAAGRNYICEVCHFGYKSSHNQNNVTPGLAWGSYDATKVDIRFDNAWNPGTVTYNGLPAGTARAPGNGGSGICAGLYCHGDQAAVKAPWNGSSTQPGWDNTPSAPCGGCHAAGTALVQGNHPVHLDNAAKPHGPGGIAVFSTALNCSEGAATGCHTAYGLSPTTNHADRTVDFRTSPSNGAATDNNVTQVCNACHSTYAVPYFDNTLVANTKSGALLAKEGWRDNTYRLPCLTCHNNDGQAAGRTANAKMDASGTWAPGIQKYWRSSGHGYPSGAPVDNTSTTTVSGNVNQVLPVLCRYCHAIDSRHFGNTTVTGNAWRLVSWSNYGDSTGGLDKFCALQCHGGGDAGTAWTCAKPGLPMDHSWIDGNGSVCPGRDAGGLPLNKEASDTHPTFQDVESTGKTKIPNEMPANRMPLESDIRNATSTNFLCVTCHDPHGTGPGDGLHWGRNFAGANATSPVDNVHMLRYDEPQATGDLCRRCHI